MSSGVILLQRPYISFSSPLLLILWWEITAVAVALLNIKGQLPLGGWFGSRPGTHWKRDNSGDLGTLSSMSANLLQKTSQ